MAPFDKSHTSFYAFHGNYDNILYHFQDIKKYRLKITIVYIDIAILYIRPSARPSVCPFVCLSVCLSVTFWYSTKTT